MSDVTASEPKQGVAKQVVVLSGLSGAGRSVAAGMFEDLGWFVIDNLPVSLVPKIADLAGSTSDYERVALVMHGYDEEMASQVESLRSELEQLRVVFLEASDEVLIRRYESTKRRHPLADDSMPVAAAIENERRRLMAAKEAADLVIDTSELNPHQLRDVLSSSFALDEDDHGMRLAVTSFGFKHGLPLDVDMVIDCRFLPNPHWNPELRPFSGQDGNVRAYVLEREVTERFLDRLYALLDELLPAYAEEGKSYFTVAFGCTGGRHRSVAVAETVASRLTSEGRVPRVFHRDIDR
jgi:UPF0042 nucleotide-binding protein